jgi:hypothetical protein
MDPIIEILRNLGSKKKIDLSVTIEDNDTLTIDCRKCLHVPEIRSSDCIRCMVGCISSHGNAERIRLRTGKDMEISGQTANILCELALLDRSVKSADVSVRAHSCNVCDYSRVNVINVAWQGFPDPYFEAARELLMKFRAEDRECANCLKKTYRALDQAELGLKNIKKKTTIITKGGN